MGIKDDMQDVQEAVINELITENGITNTLADGQVTPAKLDRAYLETTGGSISGNLGIGLTNASQYYADSLVVKAPAEGGITIASQATTDNNYLMFADGTVGNAAYRGYIGYNHNSPENMQFVSYGYMRFFTSPDGSLATERMRITADGHVILSNVPTSSSGLPDGAIYSDGGTLKIKQ